MCAASKFASSGWVRSRRSRVLVEHTRLPASKAPAAISPGHPVVMQRNGAYPLDRGHRSRKLASAGWTPTTTTVFSQMSRNQLLYSAKSRLQAKPDPVTAGADFQNSASCMRLACKVI